MRLRFFILWILLLATVAHGATIPLTLDGTGWTASSALLFPSGRPMVGDVRQGSFVGDCFMLAALESVARLQPQTIQDLFTENPDGSITVHFVSQSFVNRFPVDIAVTREVAQQQAVGALWTQVFEKAFAFYRFDSAPYHNTFAGLNGGIGDEIWYATGIPGTTISMGAGFFGLSTPQALDDYIDHANAHGLGLLFNTPAFPVDAPLVGSHEYILTDWHKVGDTIFYSADQPWGLEFHVELTWDQLTRNAGELFVGGYDLPPAVAPEPWYGFVLFLFCAIAMCVPKRRIGVLK